MWKATKYLYYKLYKLFLRMHGKDDLPELTTSIVVGILFFSNLLTLIATIDIFYPVYRFHEIPRGKFILLIGIPWLLFFYLFLAFNGKYKRIIIEFNTESEEQRKKGKTNVIIYIILSVVLFFISFSLLSIKINGLI